MWTVSDRSFDSKLVRLKANVEIPAANENDAFRFQTGSIKRSTAFARTIHDWKFRFQTGSIKRMKMPKTLSIEVTRFDSKLVRLKVTLTQRIIQLWGCFDSKLVRLKVCSRPVSVRRVCCFDSKLVRLKGGLLSVLSVRGSVSIPNWFD